MFDESGNGKFDLGFSDDTTAPSIQPGEMTEEINPSSPIKDFTEDTVLQIARRPSFPRRDSGEISSDPSEETKLWANQDERTISANESIFADVVAEAPSEVDQRELMELIEASTIERLQEELAVYDEELSFYGKSMAPKDIRKKAIGRIFWMRDRVQDAIKAKQQQGQEKKDDAWLAKIADAEKQVEVLKEEEKERDIDALQEMVHEQTQANEEIPTVEISEDDLTDGEDEYIQAQLAPIDHFPERSVNEIQELIENNLITMDRIPDPEVQKGLMNNVMNLRVRLAKERNVYLDQEGTEVMQVPEDLKPFLEEGAVNETDIVGQLGAQDTVEAFKDIDEKFGRGLVDSANAVQADIAEREVVIPEGERYSLPDGVPDEIAGKVVEAVQAEAGKINVADAVMSQITPEFSPDENSDEEVIQGIKPEIDASEEEQVDQYGGFKTAELQQKAILLRDELQDLRSKAESGTLTKDEIKSQKLALRDKFKAFLLEAGLATPENFARFGIKE